MQRSPEQILKDLSNLADAQYDLSGRLQRERDTADKKLLDAQSSLRFAKGWIWVIGSFLVGSWAVILGLLELWLKPLLEKVVVR